MLLPVHNYAIDAVSSSVSLQMYVTNSGVTAMHRITTSTPLDWSHTLSVCLWYCETHTLRWRCWSLGRNDHLYFEVVCVPHMMNLSGETCWRTSYVRVPTRAGTSHTIASYLNELQPECSNLPCDYVSTTIMYNVTIDIFIISYH